MTVNRIISLYIGQILLGGQRSRNVSPAQVRTLINSTAKTKHPTPTNKRFVYRSVSNNIFENLALEEWIYEHIDFSQRDILLMWQSDPCVVIGKHQNPWIEANVPSLKREAVHLARRSSGGGTVYHDKGNLNLSFLKDRSRYDRRENLELVVKALTSNWDLDLVVNVRDDIILDGMKKISGTAAKLTRNKSYHHFTLLHSVDRSKLSSCLASPLNDGDDTTKGLRLSVQSRSTKSVPAPTQNLQTRVPDMSMDLMIEAIVNEFLGVESQISKTVTLVNPLDERMFPGVREICQRLQSWEWLFGKTPKFSVQIDLPSISVRSVDIGVEKGCLTSLTVILTDEALINLACLLDFKGVQITKENLGSVLEKLDTFGVDSFSSAYPDLNGEHILESVRQGVSELFLCLL